MPQRMAKYFYLQEKRLMNGFRDDHPTLRVERVPRHGELKAQHWSLVSARTSSSPICALPILSRPDWLWASGSEHLVCSSGSPSRFL